MGLTSCLDDDLEIRGKLGEGETMATLKFGHNSFEKVEINSRATLNDIAESRIENLYVFVFSHTGERVYSHYFDKKNLVSGWADGTIGNLWTLENRTTTNTNNTHGDVLMKVPMLEGGSIYVIANLNADMMNISPEQLSLIETLDELRLLNETLNQEITSRSGYFLMSGGATNINISENGITNSNGSPITIDLDRLDAKVEVNLKLGQGKDGQELKRFYPESWQVMRLPKACRLIEGEGNADEMGFFDSESNQFEEINSIDNEFGYSFYVLENLKRSEGLTNYHQREQRHKNPDGTYDLEKGMWKHVDDNATYMVIKGRLQMKVKTSGDEFSMQHLEADVTYFVHLGDFVSSKSKEEYEATGNTDNRDFNDFSAKRNTHYKYNITINGVDNIEIEVETNEENQSGAIGDLYKSRKEPYTYDAHYGQRVYCIDSRDVDASTLTWYVNTPFGEGRPGLEFGTENPNLDYKWAWFMVNDLDGNKYSLKNQKYPGDKFGRDQIDLKNPSKEDKLWNVMEFTEWLRAEKIKFDNAPESEKTTASAFKAHVDEDTGENIYAIYVTVFVDEYFYNEHPLIPNYAPQDLWKEFVNKRNRVMHVLCDSKESKDGDSSVTNSVLTLRQRSIQSVYNTSKSDLKTAWGAETIDEFINSQLYYFNTNETMYDTECYTDLGNYNSITLSENNGLYNSLKMWGITLGESKWSDYFDYKVVNDRISNITNKVAHFLVDDENKLTLRYSSLMRNRDNDGDDIIDEEELVWYVASLEQLYNFYIGQPGVEREAYLYPEENDRKTIEDKYLETDKYYDAREWRLHIIPSTWVNRDGYAYPQVMWAEECFSLSTYKQSAIWKKEDPKSNKEILFAPFSTRSVRNLGIENPAMEEEGTEKIGYPEKLIKYSYDATNESYSFDLSNLNTKSLRYFTTHELEVGDEYFETSKVYTGFETGNVFQQAGGGTENNNVDNYKILKTKLENGVATGCPNGYRIPNVREGAIMALYCDSTWWMKLTPTLEGGVYFRYAMVGTTYSKGRFSQFNKDDPEYTESTYKYASWQFGHKAATVGKGAVKNLIPVRDVRK